MASHYVTQLLTQVNEAATFLKKGHLVAFPTETVYGLGAPVFNAAMIAQIFKVKGRPQDNPLIVHVSRLEQIQKLVVEIPPFFNTLTKAFFPGPLTLVLQRNPLVPAIVSGGLDTIAIRMPNHPLARALIDAVGEPLVAPSANRSGRPSSTTASHVLDDFSGDIAAVLEGGSCEHGIESTVVSLMGPAPILLRPGAITKAALEDVLGCTIEQGTGKHQGSPGMKYRHYAPTTPILLFSKEEAFKEYLKKHQKALVLKPKGMHLEYQAVFDLEEKSLYAHFRNAEKEGFSQIVIYCDSSVEEALANRIFRAAET